MKKRIIVLILTLLVSLLLAWAPWMDNQAIHDKVFQEKAHKRV
jgi:lipopolysaccharide export system protein LptC